MQRHQREAASRVGLGTLIVGIVLSLMAFGVSPAQAATNDTPTVNSQVVHRTAVPKWVGRPSTTKVQLPGTSNVSVDWKWLRAGWEIRFTKTETNIIAGGFSNCAGLLGGFTYPLPQVAFACAAISAYAWTVRAFGKCMNMFVPLSIIHFQLGARSC
jgi:hypothetical protein